MITFNNIGHYGRFGNQMFQYATLYSLAKTRKYTHGVPLQTKSEDEYHNFCLPECFPNLSAKDSTGLQQIYKIKEKTFEYNSGIFGLLDNTDIAGYFQTEKYFADYKMHLQREFDFNQDIKAKANDIRSLTREPVISLHIRLGDYLKVSDVHPVCEKSYYLEALNQLPDDLLIYIFSDDIEMAKQIFSDLKRKMVFVENTDKYIDMCLMNMCNYHIIANSSFSWWGAWLSNSKKTIAPAKWFGNSIHAPKNWSDIYSKDWIIL
jgi:hypothetical protein